MQVNIPDIYLPFDAEIIERVQETAGIFTLTLGFTDPKKQKAYRFHPGQFNMLYLFGVGEIALSILSNPNNDYLCSHAIRNVGRITHGLSLLKEGDHVGVRGPFGCGWPLRQARHKDVLVITGGLGCASSVSLIHYITQHRNDFGRLIILQGVKHSDDFIFRQQYEAWEKTPNTEVLLAADICGATWSGYSGCVTELIEKIEIDADNTICMMCGPEGMMRSAVDCLLKLSFPIDTIYLNMERNMECAVGHCGHCQFGGQFICKDGPVFCYSEIKSIIGKKGF